MGARGWPAWFGLWSAGAVGLMCALATPEARALDPHPRRAPDQVSATADAIAAVPVLAWLLLPDRGWLAVLAAVPLLVVGAALLVRAGTWMLDVEMLDRHEESESGWSKLPELLAGVGALSGAVALARRWWSTAAVSVVVGCLLAAAVVARDHDLWRLMW